MHHSTNGTYINGIRVNKEELKLQNKDEISLVVPNDSVAQEMGMKRQGDCYLKMCHLSEH
jgi:pSer/pThr/pTyr-binding forkhead associated (FHA) protein